jgi:hypothetical protein
MTVTVVYWVQYYDKELGWKRHEEIEISPERFFELAETYDVAIMNGRGYTDQSGKVIPKRKLLAIDEKGRNFRQR